jgi:4-hydroxybenzoate polyprenyltransferase
MLPRRPALGGLIRVVHPFSSVLDWVAAATIALTAGAPADVAFRLGLGMLCLQFAIGAANDYSDAASDSLAVRSKPIPDGLLSRETTARIALAAAVLGLLAAATVGVGVVVVGVVGLADGLVYDLRLKGTLLAWMPFAAGVGILPVYAWLGARGSVPGSFVGVVAVAIMAGAALALANAYGDLEEDRLSDTATPATLLGPGRTLLADACLLAIVQVVALATSWPTVREPFLLFAEGSGCCLGWLGLGLAVAGIRARALVWEVQAVGIVVLGVGWLAVLSSAGIVRS